MSPEAGFAALAATWPAAATRDLGPVRLRNGAGGGARVSAATLEGPFGQDDITAAEEAMRGEGRAPLFMVRAGEAALDAALDARGYAVKDPTVILAARLAALDAVPAQAHWPPGAAQRALWAKGGIGAARIAVMERALGPKAVLHHPGGCAFVACHGETAMLHALEVSAAARRRGAGRAVMAMAAGWAHAQGCAWLALAVTRANAPARALYARLGYEEIGAYHYREAPA
ncbi:GNAT family N-acetyltransferase [Limimaricola cinnabarinus]|uniref:GNAT family N-acetyltransferase n=1 Tax=Limimaricola cinnabarinus TaxID=1125964 RepID=UPI0024904733|nr:GNAT family N-acetyltransferase [Limimaricola cinnabarinus]